MNNDCGQKIKTKDDIYIVYIRYIHSQIYLIKKLREGHCSTPMDSACFMFHLKKIKKNKI